ESRHLQTRRSTQRGHAADAGLQSDHARAFFGKAERPHRSLLPRKLALRARRESEDAGLRESEWIYRGHAAECRHSRLDALQTPRLPDQGPTERLAEIPAAEPQAARQSRADHARATGARTPG